jgi:hypothetical protein
VIDPPENLTSPVSLEAVPFQPRYKGFFAKVFDVCSFRHEKKDPNPYFLGSLLGALPGKTVNATKRDTKIFLT